MANQQQRDLKRLTFAAFCWFAVLTSPIWISGFWIGRKIWSYLPGRLKFEIILFGRDVLRKFFELKRRYDSLWD